MLLAQYIFVTRLRFWSQARDIQICKVQTLGFVYGIDCGTELTNLESPLAMSEILLCQPCTACNYR